MKRFNLPHRLVILDNGKPEWDTLVKQERMQDILSFASIAEAVLMGRLRFDEGSLVVDNDIPSPYEEVEEVVSAIGSSPAMKPMEQWAEELAVQVPFYLLVRDKLVKENILHRQRKRILGIPWKSWYFLNDQRLITGYLSGLEEQKNNTKPDIRDLISMIFLQNTALKEVSFLSINIPTYIQQLDIDDPAHREIVELALKL